MATQRATQSEVVSELLTALADRYCREILLHFRESPEETATLADLVEAVNHLDGRDSKRIAVQLHHSSLPRLDEVGVVEYDARSNAVRHEGHPKLGPLLACIDDI